MKYQTISVALFTGALMLSTSASAQLFGAMETLGSGQVLVPVLAVFLAQT